ncbi:MAG: carbohydrate kinase family protein [Lachnospiraceae bacterium]|nr:carbohydrate kinase family protein [Lachnospiraceae bacterium]
MERDLDVLCVGGLVCDFMIRPVDAGVFTREVSYMEAAESNVGGDAANESIVMGKLANKVAISAEIGDDGTANELKAVFAKSGVNTDHLIVRKNKKTRTNIVLIRPDGERHFVIFPNGYDEFCGKDLDYEVLSRTKVLSIGSIHHLPLLDPALPAYLKAGKEAGCITSADMCPNLGDTPNEIVVECCKYLDYLIPSEGEMRDLFGEDWTPQEAARTLRNWGVKHVVIKLGAEGCYIQDDVYDEFVPSFRVKAIDTTGAGDSFAGGFLTGVLKGWDLKKCAIFGAATGCIAVQSIGANTGVKSYEQVLAVAKTSPDWKE